MSWVNIVRITIFHLVTITLAVRAGITPTAAVIFVCVFYFQAFVVSAFNHRYFSHKVFDTSRSFQFAMAWLASMSGQKGSLSWATSHRLHHAHTEKERDPHSPYPRGFWHAHMGWLLLKGALPTSPAELKDLWRFPELRWINRFHVLGPVSLFIVIFFVGKFIEGLHPELHTSLFQVLVWGYLCPTVVSVQTTCLTNSMGHGFWRGLGKQRFDMKDSSSNLWWLFPFSLGENWHNNHHRYPRSASSGVGYREPDLIYAGILVLEKLGLVWNVRVHGATVQTSHPS